MGILRFLGFGNPISDYLEDAFSKKIVESLEKNGTVVPPEWRKAERKIRRQIQSGIQDIVSDQNERLKPVWNEFKPSIPDQVQLAIETAAEKSNLGSYSDEKYYKEIIAISKQALYGATLKELPCLLKKKIGLKELKDETREGIASYAMNKKFDDILSDLMSDKTVIKVGAYEYIVADMIENDRYYIDGKKTSDQVDMIFFSKLNQKHVFALGENPDKVKRREREAKMDAIKAARAVWREHKANRPDDRNFSQETWDKLNRTINPC